MTFYHATFKVRARGLPNPTFQWYIGDNVNPELRTLLDGKTSANLQLSSLEDPMYNGAKYSCKVSNSLGYVWSRLAELTITGAPVFTTQPESGSVIQGNTLSLTAIASGTPTPNYIWYKNDVPLSDGGRVSGVTTSNLQISNFESADAGDYKCYGYNAAGFVFSNVATITDGGPPSETCLYSSGYDGTVGWDETPIESFYSETAGLPNGFQQETPAYPFTNAMGDRTLPFTPTVVSAYMHTGTVFDNYSTPSEAPYSETILRQSNWKMSLRMDTNYDTPDQVQYTISINIYAGPSYTLVHSEPIVNDGFIDTFPTTINGPGNQIYKAVQTAPDEITFYMNNVSFYVLSGYNMDTYLAFEINSAWIDFSFPVYHGYPTISKIKAGLIEGPNTCWNGDPDESGFWVASDGFTFDPDNQTITQTYDDNPANYPFTNHIMLGADEFAGKKVTMNFTVKDHGSYNSLGLQTVRGLGLIDRESDTYDSTAPGNVPSVIGAWIVDLFYIPTAFIGSSSGALGDTQALDIDTEYTGTITLQIPYDPVDGYYPATFTMSIPAVGYSNTQTFDTALPAGAAGALLMVGGNFTNNSSLASYEEFQITSFSIVVM